VECFLALFRVRGQGAVGEAVALWLVGDVDDPAGAGQLHHYALLFLDDMVEALARDIESRLVEGTMRAILQDLTGSLIDLI
jgi:hypothetical protein